MFLDRTIIIVIFLFLSFYIIYSSQSSYWYMNTKIPIPEYIPIFMLFFILNSILIGIFYPKLDFKIFIWLISMPLWSYVIFQRGEAHVALFINVIWFIDSIFLCIYYFHFSTLFNLLLTGLLLIWVFIIVNINKKYKLGGLLPIS